MDHDSVSYIPYSQKCLYKISSDEMCLKDVYAWFQ